MYNEDDLLPIAALQHLAFCERQWGLMYLEHIWAENVLTAEGGQLHEKADSAETEVRGNLRIARSLRVRSLNLGITGVTDVVEFHRIISDQIKPQEHSEYKGITLDKVDGIWKPVPIEYKHGKPKTEYCDEVQLCAQALCLEEMLDAKIPDGIIYYGQPNKRYDVTLGDKLRTETKDLITKLHKLNELGITPPPVYKKYCRSCSIYNLCLPKVVSKKMTAKMYIDNIISDAELSDERDLE